MAEKYYYDATAAARNVDFFRQILRHIKGEWAGQPFVLFEVGSATRRVIDRFFASEQIEPTIVMDTENVEIIKAMVKTGLGIGIVPYQACQAVTPRTQSPKRPMVLPFARAAMARYRSAIPTTSRLIV